MEDKLYESEEEAILEQKEFSQYRNTINIKDRIKIVGNNMAFLRKKAGLSQKDVADIIECAIQTYSGYENGRHEPNIESIVRLSWLYNVSADILVGKYEGIVENQMDIWPLEVIEQVSDNPKFEQIQQMLRKLKLMEADIDMLKEKLQ